MSLKAIPYTYTTEYTGAAHGHQVNFGIRLNRTADFDAFFADQPNCKYWEIEAQKATTQLIEQYGPNRAAAWMQTLPESNTIQDDCLAIRTVLACRHEHTAMDTQGQMHFCGGDVWDDFKTILICTDCLMVIDGPKPKGDDDIPGAEWPQPGVNGAD